MISFFIVIFAQWKKVFINAKSNYMKKLLLSIALVLLCGVTMAQTTVNLTFVRNGENASVNVEGMDGVTATIEATSPSPQGNATKTGVWNTGGDMGTDTNILCTSTNTSAATTPITYTLTLSGIDASMALSNIVFKHITANASGNYQPHTNGDIRHCNIALNVNGSNIETKNDFDIWVQGAQGSAGKDVAFENINDIKANDGILTITLSISKGTNNNGCFYGLKNVAITFIQEEVVEPEPTFANSYTLTQVTASDLMSKKTATRIAIQNVAFNNHNWLDIKATAGNNCPAEYSEDVVFIWEPVEAGKAGSYRIKDNNGEYLQNDANGNVITLGTIDNAAVFTAVEPTFSYDEASKIFSESEQDKLVRFKRTDNVWINTQQPAQLAKYNTGTGTFTIHFAYELTEVEKFTADFTKAEYASFYAPGSVTIPEGVEAYYLTNEGFNGDHVTLTKIDGGIIPALTAVILKSNNDEVIDLSVTEESSTEDLSANLFKGTVVKRHIQVEESGAYVLGIADEEVGLYKSNKTAITNTYTIHVFLNNANKAYLPASAVPATANNSASFSFRFGEGTTGISEVKGENGEVKTVYDLTGRKLKGENGNLKGIYIINGKKVLVK